MGFHHLQERTGRSIDCAWNHQKYQKINNVHTIFRLNVISNVHQPVKDCRVCQRVSKRQKNLQLCQFHH